MRIFGAMKKIVISACAFVLSVCGFGAIAATQSESVPNQAVVAQAETVTSASMDWRGTYTNSTTVDYCYIGFAGFTTQDDYSGNANSDYVFQNILINGTSVYDINANTDVSGWEWDVFPSTEGAKYEKPVLGYIKDTNGRIQLRIHKNLHNACLEKDGYFVITVCEGFTLNGYVIDKETSYRIQDGASKSAEKTPTMDWRGAYTEGTTLDYCYIGFAGFTTQDDYSGNANSDYVFQNILLNGKSIYEINATTDTTGWLWEVFPSTAGAQYEKPVIGYIKDTNGRIQLRIHKNLSNALLLEDGYVRLTVKKRFLLNGYIVPADTTFEVMTATEADVTNDTWDVFSDANELYRTYLSFSGFSTKDDYNGNANSNYVFQNIFINGTSIYDINANTDVSGWNWQKFPQDTMEKYQKPVIGYIGEAGKLELRIHKNLVDALLAKDKNVTLTVQAFVLNGYVAESVSFELVRMVDNTLTVNGWNLYSNATQLYVTKMSFTGFSAKTDYDVNSDEYVLENIFINGKSLSEINEKTNVSDWTWEVFPQTEDNMPKYRVPVLMYAKGDGTLELRFHKNFYDTMVASYGCFKLTVAEGFSMGDVTIAGETTYALKDSVWELSAWEQPAAATVSIDWRGSYDGSSTMNYLYLHFAGFSVVSSYDGDANSDAVFQNIYLNGTSIYEINTTTDVTGWAWDTFPQNADAKWCKPVLGYIKDSGRLQLRIHQNLIDALIERDGYIQFTVPEGFSVNYMDLEQEASFKFVMVNGALTAAQASGVSLKQVDSTSATVKYMYLYFDGFNTKVNYDAPAENDYVFKNIYINGVSIHDINKNTDVSGWAWDVFPQNEQAAYRKPVISYIGGTASSNKYIELRVHNNFYDELLLRDGYFEITVAQYFTLNGYILLEETSFEVASLQESAITVDTWNSYPGASQLYYAYIHFGGFNTDDAYNGAAVSEYVLGNIFINGASISAINASTDVSGWTWEIFPQTADAKYQKAILAYTNGTGKLELRIHKNFYNQIIAEYGAFEISVSKNFIWNGYICRDGVRLVKNSNNVFVEPTVISANSNAVSVSRWQPMDGQELVHFDINYTALSKIDYAIMDVAAYAYIANMIEINGVKLSAINMNTDVTGWNWLVFPSTASATYQKPFVAFVESGKMTLRMHYNYWETIQDSGLQVSLLPGYYIENGGTMYVLSEKITYTKEVAVNAFTQDGFYRTAEKSAFDMIYGASVRMYSESTGIRFTAAVSESYLAELTSLGYTYRLMMQINREGSTKTAFVEGQNFYTENGYLFYNGVIINLKESSYALEFTARPYIEITDGSGNVFNVYTQTLSQTRTIKDVAYRAYTDFAEEADDYYKFEIVWEGKTMYSPYSLRQRDLLASFVTDVVLLSDGVYQFVNESDKNFIMISDNAEANTFFENYADRFVYYYKNFEEAEDCVTNTVVGNASTTWKDWEAESILFMNSTHLNGNDEQFNNDIQNAKVDKYGYVWEGDAFFGQGWNSPNYIGSRATTSAPFLSDGWEFANGRKNSAILAVDSGATGNWGACDVDWTVKGDGTFASATVATGITNAEDGYFLADAKGSTYVTYSLEDTRSMYNGVLQAAHSPFVEIGLQWNLISGSINEIYFEFKAGDGEYVSLPLSQWATTEIDFSAKINDLRLYVPVFEHESWTGKITGLRVKIEGNFTAYYYLDFVRGSYDLRMVDSNTSFISAGKQHFEKTGDLAFLTANINQYRKALMFLTNYMADNGLINLSNFVGHDGSAQGFATSFISTYWDIVSLAPNSSYVNALYYKALLNMAYLEEAVAVNNVQTAMPTVKTTLMGADIVYNYTASELRSMAAAVKTAVSADLNETAKTGYFKTFTVNVGGETVQAGRFIEGYYGDTQIDFGAVALNLMILESGVATDEQKTLVMNWIASIDNLYEYTFAPKTNTEDIGNQYCWAYIAADYGVSCQNGGAILFVSYYDVMARAQVYGVENAYARLSEIMAWFADAEEAFAASGETDAEKFFEVYYANSGLTLQGSNKEGTLGLHAEFIENAILYALVPNVFFGLDTYYGEDGLVMQIAPNLPDAIGTWKMEQVRYAGLVYDVAIGNDFVMICNVEELADGALDRGTKIAVTLSYTGNSPKVYINNKLVSSGYTVNASAKTVTVLLDANDVNVSLR